MASLLKGEPVMVDVVVEENCGNAPKKAVIKDWLVSLAASETDKVTFYIPNGITGRFATFGDARSDKVQLGGR